MGRTSQYEIMVRDLLKEIYPKHTFTRQKTFRGSITYYHEGKKFTGIFFKVDFCNEDLKLVIEVDDRSHKTGIRKAKDKAVDMSLKRRGYRILRIPTDSGFLQASEKMIKKVVNDV